MCDSVFVVVERNHKPCIHMTKYGTLRWPNWRVIIIICLQPTAPFFPLFCFLGTWQRCWTCLRLQIWDVQQQWHRGKLCPHTGECELPLSLQSTQHWQVDRSQWRGDPIPWEPHIPGPVLHRHLPQLHFYHPQRRYIGLTQQLLSGTK